MLQVTLKQYFEGYKGGPGEGYKGGPGEGYKGDPGEGYKGGPGELKVLDIELFRTEEGRSAIVTLDNPRGTNWSHAYIT